MSTRSRGSRLGTYPHARSSHPGLWHAGGPGLALLAAACAPPEARAFERVADLRATLDANRPRLSLVRGAIRRPLSEEMRALVWRDPRVRTAMARFDLWLEADSTRPARLDSDTAIHGLGVWAVDQGRVIGALRGYCDAETLTAWLNTVAESAPTMRTLSARGDPNPAAPSPRGAELDCSLDLATQLIRTGAIQRSRRLIDSALQAAELPSRSRARALLLSAALRLELGEVSAAASELDPLAPSIDPALEALSALLRACCLRVGAQPSAAIRPLSAWLERHADHEARDRARFELAHALHQCGRTTEALAMLQTLRREHPDSRFTRNARQLMLDWIEAPDEHHAPARPGHAANPR